MLITEEANPSFEAAFLRDHHRDSSGPACTSPLLFPNALSQSQRQGSPRLCLAAMTSSWYEPSAMTFSAKARSCKEPQRKRFVAQT